MINTTQPNTSEVRAEQAANAVSHQLPEAIYLGVDLHKASIWVTRIIDRSAAQPAQRFDWPGFWRFVKKQISLATRVYVVYEAGAFGFWIARKLREMGVECYVVHPEKLDPRCKRVQTDKLDSAHLADKLQRYVLGNKKAMVPVYVPTLEQEHNRMKGRHRRHLSQQLQRLRARGRGLLLSQGIFTTTSWWRESNWIRLPLEPVLREILTELRLSIEHYEKQLVQSERRLEAQAPKELPLGFGKLTFVLLLSELCNYQRFKNRRAVGGFSGLCGGVSSSGPYHLDLSINKSGSPQLRALLVELAWRMIYYQRNYTGLRVWKRLCTGPTSARRRKIALVAVARQVLIDIWKWQTGRASPQELGWQMREV